MELSGASTPDADESAQPASEGSAVSNDDSVEPDTSPARLAADNRVDDERVLPGHNDIIGRDAVGVIGGPVGQHAVIGRQRYLTPMRVVMFLALIMLSLSWFGKAGCLQQAPTGPDGAQELDWRNNRQYIALCYSDTVPLYSAEKLNTASFPYKASWFQQRPDGSTEQRFMEYPVLTGVFMYAAAQTAHGWSWLHNHAGFPGAIDVVLFFNVVALLLTAMWLVTIWATGLLARNRIWWVLLAALSPLVLVHAFTNFDAIATAFLALAMLAWSRRNPLWTGVFIGLGAAAKLYPALLLIPLLLLCLRTGKVRPFAITTCTAIAAWIVVNAPIAIVAQRGWREFFRYNSDRGADPDTWFHVVTQITGYAWGADANGKSTIINAAFVGLFAVICVGVAVLALRAPTRPRLAQLLFLVVAGFLIVNKVWSPQYSLWLVPLAVLAIPHTRIVLAWMVIDALVWIPRMGLFVPENVKWLPEQWFTAAIVLRLVVVLALCVVVVWEILHPNDDPVRNGPSGEIYDDPAGGVFDRAVDAIGSGFRRSKNAVPEAVSAR